MSNPFKPILDLIDWIRDPMGVNRLIDRKLPTGTRKLAPPTPPPPKQEGPPSLPFVELAGKAINFLDDEKHPLINPALLAQKKAGYQLNERVTDEAVTARVLQIFKEVAPRTASIPPAEAGRYAHVPIQDVLMNVGEDELRAFLSYVDRFPKKYIGQEVRIANAYVAWVRAGAE